MFWSHLTQSSIGLPLFQAFRPRPHINFLKPRPQLSLFSLAACFPRRPLSVSASLPPGFRSNYGKGARVSPYVAVTGVGLALSFYQSSNTIHCEAVPPAKGTAPQPGPAPLPPPPPSSVNVYELTFGTVCGICAGVFVKKGAKLLAFAFGGIFVLLQYLGSQSLVKVDWGRMAQKFENLAFTKDAQGYTRAPTIGSLFGWIVDFLTADFQQRASFVAGFALGLRVG